MGMRKDNPKKKIPNPLKFWSDLQEKSDSKIKGYIDIQRAKSDEDMKRHIGALSEDFQSKVAFIAEQYGDIKKELSSHTEMIGDLSENMEIVKTNIEFIKNELKKKVDYDEFISLERRVRLLEEKV